MEAWVHTVETDHDVDILFACEAGSKAWGYASANSDQDIRFIYIHRDKRKYVSLDPPPEVIDYRNPYDAQGWDILKAFRLLRKSNPSLFEWSYSPVVYVDRHHFGKKLRKTIQDGYSAYSLGMHYLRLAKRNIKEAEQRQFNKSRQKQLLYSLRSLLIVRSLLDGKIISAEIFPHGHNEGNGMDKESKAFRIILEAKQNQELITLEEREAVVEMLKSFLNRLTVQVTQLEKGKNLTRPLNDWLWDLLNFRFY